MHRETATMLYTVRDCTSHLGQALSPLVALMDELDESL